VALNGITIRPNSRGDFFYNYTLATPEHPALHRDGPARNTVVVVRAITFDRLRAFLQSDTPVNGLLTNHINVDVLGGRSASRADGHACRRSSTRSTHVRAAASRTGTTC